MSKSSVYLESSDDCEADRNSSEDETANSHGKRRRLDDASSAPDQRMQTAAVKVLLPPPLSLAKMYECVEDDGPSHDDDRPELHSGKVRSFPHERGNWSTYVYLPYDVCGDHMEQLSQFVSTISLVRLRSCDDLHISLSKTVIMRHHWIQPFTDSLKCQLQAMRPFFISTVRLEAYMNEEKTRTFLGVKVDAKELLHLVAIVNESLSKFNLPSFYKDPSFHLSFGWCVGNRWRELNELIPNIQDAFESAFEDSPLLAVLVKSISCKTGNKVYTFPFGVPS